MVVQIAQAVRNGISLLLIVVWQSWGGAEMSGSLETENHPNARERSGRLAVMFPGERGVTKGITAFRNRVAVAVGFPI